MITCPALAAIAIGSAASTPASAWLAFALGCFAAAAFATYATRNL